MDIYDYLKLDHANVAQLFKYFEKSDSSSRQQQIVAVICQELFVHAKSEQDTFYKVLENYETTKEMASHGEKEHSEIYEQIKKINESKGVDAAWKKKVIKLKELVEHHVKEEEGAIFRKAKKVLTEEEAYILKEKMHYLKMQLLRDQEAKNSPKDKPSEKKGSVERK
ncbi:MAG: hemerythrin domain-containing protein [Tatlockia sp.]|nr:hemerythrin domain-containing protein [Tatlockia sp.]